MKTLQIFFSAAFILMLTSLHGQKEPVRIGVKAGGALSSVSSHGVDLGLGILEPKSIATPRVGVFADISLGKGWYLSPEVAYSQKGFRVSEGFDVNVFEIPVPIGADLVTRMQYLEAPLNLKYAFGGEKVRGFVRGGPYVGYAMSGEVETRLNSIIDLKIATIPIDPAGNLYDRWEFGATAGAGLEFDLGRASLMTELSYTHSFTDFTDVPVIDAGLKNRAFGLSVGVSIPIGTTSKINRT